MRPRHCLAALAAMFALVAPAQAADPVPGALYEGTTEDGNPFQFRVSPDGQTVTDVLTSTSITCVGSQGGVEIKALASQTPFPVAGGAISGEDEAASPRLEMNGAFASPGEAAGRLTASFAKFDYSGGGLTTCFRELAWTARTASAPPSAGGGGVTPGGGGTTPVGGGGAVPQGPAPGPVAGAAPAVTVSFPSGVKLKPSLSNGWIVGGTVDGPATLKGKVTLPKATARRYDLGKKKVVVARAKEVLAAAGEFGLEFKPSKRTAKKLREADRLTFDLSIKAIGADGSKSTKKQKITLGK